jgi:3-phosphoshikimate 1-carboxyvinyltransferase
MEKCIYPSTLNGTVKAPSSKSMMQRAIAAAMLTNDKCVISNPSYCDDALAAMNIIVGLGAKVEPLPDRLIIEGGGALKEKKLNCGESGLAMRMFSPIAALFAEEITLTGANSLRKRPMNMIVDALSAFGVKCSSAGGLLPISVKGPLKGGKIEIDGSLSSQLLTGLLMALPLAKNDSEIIVNNLKSKPYIDMTIQILNDFGITIINKDYTVFSVPANQKYLPRDYAVEGDWSGGAFLLVAGAINSKIKVEGLQQSSAQSDKNILTALKEAGAKMDITNDAVTVEPAPLKSFTFDATHSPDLFPPLAALAAYCNGETVIKGVSRLIHKESNRANAIVNEFSKLGIKIIIEGDIMKIRGGKATGGRVESHEDHRIAMAMAVTAISASGKVCIRDSQSVAKSYPEFFNDLKLLGVRVE